MSVFFDPFRSLTNEPFGQQFGSGLAAGGDAGLYPDTENLLAWYRTDIVDGKLKAWLPPGTSHTTQQVKGSGFAGIGSGALTGLLTTDTLTSSGPNTPTCTVDGTVTFGADCWDFFWHRDGVLMGYYPGINVGGTFEIDASGNGHTLYLTDTTITERLDGTGTNYANERGFTVADGTQYLEQTFITAIGVGWMIPALTDGSGCAAYLDIDNISYQLRLVDSNINIVDGLNFIIG